MTARRGGRRRRHRRGRRAGGRTGAGLGPAGVHPHPRWRGRRERRRPPRPARGAGHPGRLRRRRRRRRPGSARSWPRPACGWRCGRSPAPPPAPIVSLVEPGGQRSMLADRGANLALRAGRRPGRASGRPPAPVRVHAARPRPAGGRPRGPGGRRRGRLHRLGGPGVDRAAGAATAWSGGSADTASATVLLPNADEARLLTGCADVADAARALAGRHPVVAVSLGADGALWASGDVLGAPAGAPDGRSSTPPARATRSRPGCSRPGWARRASTRRDALDAGLALAAGGRPAPGAR